MIDMDEMSDFVRAALDVRQCQLEEDEQVATACPDRSWRQIGNGAGAEHIAHFDPQRMLAEVEQGRRDIAAKRALLDWFLDCEAKALDANMWNLDVEAGLKLLALPFAGQPGYRPAWAPQHVPYNEVVDYSGDDD